ncbi:MAG: hypothetical protein HKN12_02935, partial [Gemmatimonadetes bacterium]|nr:hypothetical protein [Gemmatimonadota bacterium]
MIPESWLVWAAIAIASSQGALVLVLVLRNAWVEWRLRRLSGRSRLLENIFSELDAGTSATVRNELGRGEILADIRALEQWLDLVVRRGEDPACLSPEEYEIGGIVERYLTALRSERRWVRRAAAAEILGWTRSPRAVSALLATALDTVGEPPPVRQVALRSLERIHHPDAAPEMIAALETAETWFLPRAAGVLARIGEGAVEPLIRELSDRNRPASSRRWAAQILGEIGDRRAVATLQEALGDVDPELRARAAKALGRLRDPASVKALLQRLVNDPSSFVRTSVASALGQLPTRETVEFLARSLSDPEWWVRLRAVESLAGLGSPARDTLRGALHDRDPSVAREAARALERMGVVAEAIDTMKEDGYSPEVAELLHDVGVAGSLDTMLDALRDADVALATQLVRILGRIGDRRAGAALAASLGRTDNPALETRLIQALQRVGAAGFDDEVAPRLASPDEWVRVSCLGYLEELGDAERLPDLTALLNEPLAGVRCAALRAVKRMRPADFPADTVLRLLGDLDPSVRAAAARALAALGRHDLLLRHGIHHDRDSVISALIAALGPPRGEDSVRLAQALFPRARDEELEHLAAHVRDAAQEYPLETYEVLDGEEDPASRWALATAAGALMSAGIQVELTEFLRDEDARVRAAAVRNAVHADEGALVDAVAARVADRSSL